MRNILLLLLCFPIFVFGVDFNNQLEEASVMPYSQFSFKVGSSPIGGVGLFATHDLAAGTPIVWEVSVRKWKDKDVPAPFINYCVALNDEEILGPENFDTLHIVWFLNHSTTPNIIKLGEEPITDRLYRAIFRVTKDIKAGDEILLNYNDLKEPEHRKSDFYKKEHAPAPEA